MQSFLIIAKDKNTASDYSLNLLKANVVNALDVNLQAYEKAMGIADVRNIQKAILLKPFRGKTKAVIIEIYEGITMEAQNALLKILEEPPANTIIIISTSSKELILPTIISRCKVIILQKKEIKLAQTDLSEFEKTLSILLDNKIGDKLKIAQDITRDKEGATLWIEKMSVFVREELIKNHSNPKYSNILRLIQKTYGDIKNTNVNQRIAMETLFLAL